MRDNEILVSVYCLTFNHEKYIRSALDAFVNQKTNFKYEVIVHDDASTDNTQAIIKKYAEQYPQIIKPVLQAENMYSKDVDIVKEFIFPNVKGKYIAICEGDDFWIDENKLQKQVDFMEENAEYAACVHNTKLYDMRTNEERIMFANVDKDLTLKDVIRGGSRVYHTSSIIYRSEHAFKRPDYLNALEGVGDYPLSIFLATQGGIKYFKDVMSVYRYNVSGSWTERQGQLSAHRDRCEQSVKMLQMAKAESADKFTLLFDDAIARCRYRVDLYDHGYKVLMNKQYRQFFKEESMKSKIKFLLERYIPGLYKLYRKIR